MYATGFFRPCRGFSIRSYLPTACAVGCILSPLSRLSLSSRLNRSLICDSRHKVAVDLVGAGPAGPELSCSERPILLSWAPATVSDFRRWTRLLPGWFRAFRKLTRRNFWLFETSRRQTSGSSGWFGVRGYGAICAHLRFCLLSAASVSYVWTCTERLRSDSVVPAFRAMVPRGAWVRLVAWLEPCPAEDQESSADLRFSRRLRLRLLGLRGGGWSGWEAGRHRESCITAHDS